MTATRSDRALRAVLVVLSTIPATGCGADTGRHPYVEVDTLPGGTVHVRYTVDPAARGPALVATEQLRIGLVDGGAPYVFGRIAGLALMPDVGVAVVEAQTRQVRIFAGDGTHVRTFGGPGSGPGELGSPRGVRWSPRGTLFIADFGNQRYVELTRDGELVATYRRDLPAWGVDWQDWQGGFDADGFLYDAGVRGGDRQQPIHVRYRIDDGDVVPVDTFPLPAVPGESFVVRGAVLLNLPVPFAPRPSWAFDGRDAIWAGTAERYAITKRSLAGDTLLLLEAAVVPEPVSAEERAAARRDIESMVERAGGAGASIDFARIPATKPAYGRLRIDDRARLWVPRTPAVTPAGGASPAPAAFDVFDSDGSFIGQVTLDVQPDLPFAFRNDRVAGVHRDELGVETVVVYRIGF
jgi:hypothetical protein